VSFEGFFSSVAEGSILLEYDVVVEYHILERIPQFLSKLLNCEGKHKGKVHPRTGH
jgi:hypothetical protein